MEQFNKWKRRRVTPAALYAEASAVLVLWHAVGFVFKKACAWNVRIRRFGTESLVLHKQAKWSDCSNFIKDVLCGV